MYNVFIPNFSSIFPVYLYFCILYCMKLYLSLGKLYLSCIGYDSIWCRVKIVNFFFSFVSSTHTHTSRVHNIHSLTVQGHPIPVSRPTHLGCLGGGALEYTVVVWPRAPAWLDCQRLSFSPSGQCALRCCQRLGHTASLYLQTAAK